MENKRSFIPNTIQLGYQVFDLDNCAMNYKYASHYQSSNTHTSEFKNNITIMYIATHVPFLLIQVLLHNKIKT